MKDGGPAFPGYSYWDARVETYRPVEGTPGMSLRDYFAAAALTGIVSADFHASESDKVAPLAYALADAMIAERGKNDSR